MTNDGSLLMSDGLRRYPPSVAREAHGIILKALAGLLNAHRDDDQFDADVQPSEAVRVAVSTINSALDEIMKHVPKVDIAAAAPPAAAAAAAPSMTAQYVIEHCEPMSAEEIYAEGRSDQWEQDAQAVRLLLENCDDEDAHGEDRINTTRVRELLSEFWGPDSSVVSPNSVAAEASDQAAAVARVVHRAIPSEHGTVASSTFDIEWLTIDPFKWSGNLYAAPSAALAASEREAVAYLMTRPSGFAWPLMPKDVTPEWREVCKADGITITPLCAFTSRERDPIVFAAAGADPGRSDVHVGPTSSAVLTNDIRYRYLRHGRDCDFEFWDHLNDLHDADFDAAVDAEMRKYDVVLLPSFGKIHNAHAIRNAPTLPSSLLNLIGEYGMARTDRVSPIDVLHRWQLLIDGIKTYALSIPATGHDSTLTEKDEPKPVAWQVRRTDGSPLATWEACAKELYDTTLATGRYRGYENGPPCEVRALYAAAFPTVALRALQPLEAAVAAVVRDIGELDPADATALDTLIVPIDDLRRILARHLSTSSDGTAPSVPPIDLRLSLSARGKQPVHQREDELQALELEHMGDPDKKTGIYSPHYRVGWWLSAALEDPNTCEEMKQGVRDWFATSFESSQAELPKPLTKLQIDDIVVAGGFHNAAGGIYATCVHSFVRAIESAHGISGDAPDEQQHG